MLHKLLAVSIFLILIGFFSDCRAESIAVIVNRENKLENITVPQLARMFKGKQQFWPDGGLIVLINRPMDSAIRKDFFQYVLDAKPDQKFFLPGNPVPFKTIIQETDIAVVRFIGNMPEAIGYIYLSELKPELKTDKIKIVTLIEIPKDINKSGD